MSLKNAGHDHYCFRLYLECAISAGLLGLGTHVYGFITNGALPIYESDVMAKGKFEFSALRLLIGTLTSLTCLDREQRVGLAKKVAQYCTKIINLDDQATVLQMCTLLFNAQITPDDQGSVYKDLGNMQSCLKKSMKSVTEIDDPQQMAALYVQLLDTFIYFFISYEDVVNAQQINGLLTKMKQEFSEKAIPKSSPALTHLTTIQTYISWKQKIKNNAKSALEALEAAHYIDNPLPVVNDPKDKAQVSAREKVREEVRSQLKPTAETKAKSETEKWLQITL